MQRSLLANWCGITTSYMTSSLHGYNIHNTNSYGHKDHPQLAIYVIVGNIISVTSLWVDQINNLSCEMGTI